VQASRGNLDLGARVWHRFDEEPENDDNPDITRYLGYGELFAGYQIGRHHVGLMLRNPANHVAVQADWSYGLSDRLRFYVQYFNGYGESLIDYDRQVNRIGAGFLLNEWP
jgi:phospholipase A1